MKRELVEFKRAVVPLQRPLLTLTGRRNRLVPKEIRRYFRDVQDHLTAPWSRSTRYDDLLNSILQARLAQVTVDQNNDMRKIASWAAIAAVVDRHRRHLRHELPAHAGAGLAVRLPGRAGPLMLVVSVLLYRAFRRTGWL